MIERKKVVTRALSRLLKRETAPVPLGALLNNWRHGFGGWSYLYYELGRHGRYDDYLPDITMRDMTALNTGSGKMMLTNKLMFERVVGKLARVPPVLAMVGRGTLVPIASPELRTAADLAEYCRAVGPLILKPIDGMKGKGVLRLSSGQATRADPGAGARTDTDAGPGSDTRGGTAADQGPDIAGDVLQLNGREIAPADLAKTLAKLDNYLVVTFVRQAGYARAIFPDSANTMRIVTMIDPATDRPFIAASEHRFGVAASAPTDNVSRGGLSCRVDPDTGRLGPGICDGRTTIVRTNVHPETGAKLEGVEVEHWREAKDMVLNVAQALPFAPYVGWDVLVSDDGPVLIEGNAGPSMHSQMHFPYLLDERVRRFVEHHGVWRTRRRARADGAGPAVGARS